MGSPAGEKGERRTALGRVAFWLLVVASLAVGTPRPVLAAPARTQETFTAAAARQLEAALIALKVAGLTVTVTGPLSLNVGPKGRRRFEISLDRPWASCGQAPERCEEASADYLKSVAETIAGALEPPAPLERAQLRVVVRSGEYVAAVRAKKQDPVVVPLAGDLWALVMVDGARMARSLRRKDLAALRLDDKGALTTAVANVVKDLGGVGRLAPDPAGQQIGALTPPDYYNCGLVAALAEWGPLARSMKGPLLVSVPSDRDVLFADGGVSGALAALTAVTDKSFAAAEKPVSRSVLRWSAGGWSLATAGR